MQSRSISWVAILLIFFWLILACFATRGDTETLPPQLPPPLRSVPVPEPAHLDQFVADRAAAIRLGKALFWDMQVGSDGIQACGSCHFHAGADSRHKNQLNPDLNGNDPTFLLTGGSNATLTAQDFPFHRLANPEDPNSVFDDSNDVVASQGVFKTLFVDIVPGSAEDRVIQTPDAVFNVRGINTRRVEPRNAPTVINSIFNHRNFWDGRAQSEFNGVNPFGYRDANAQILKVDMATGMPALTDIGITEGASLASLSCGPPLSPNEMSAEGRTLPKLGKKMLSLRPLARQLVAPDDSVLGSLSSARRGRNGLETTYQEMIQAAFRLEWWRSPAVVSTDASGTPTVRIMAHNSRAGGKRQGHEKGNNGQGNGKNGQGQGGNGPGNGNGGQAGNGSDNGNSNPPALTTGQYTVTEANFALFFGLSIQLYLATLVSDDTSFDRFLSGENEALTPQEQTGLQLFMNKEKAGCVNCHVGSELTEASYSECYQERIDELKNLNGVDAKYDKGFVNTGVRPTGNDVAIGGMDQYGNPLADTRRLQLAQLPSDSYNLPVGPEEAIAVDGAFKIPGLRNVELTGPYFHNGGVATLEQVVEFYNRGGDFSQEDRNNVRDLMRPLHLTAEEKAALVAFLKSLTDGRVRFERAPFDHPQIFVPNGHPGDQNNVISDGAGKARDTLIEIPAVGAGGGRGLSPVF